jgi:hypothetical protein
VVRITTHHGQAHTVVTIDGQLSAVDLDEVRRVRDALSGPVVLELDGLDSCSNNAVRLLRDWVRAGARVDRATPFLRMALEDQESA